jgi:hypothetical protein
MAHIERMMAELAAADEESKTDYGTQA